MSLRCPASLISQKGAGMNDKHINTILGYMVIAVIGYFIVKALFPYLLFTVIGLLIFKYINRK